MFKDAISITPNTDILTMLKIYSVLIPLSPPGEPAQMTRTQQSSPNCKSPTVRHRPTTTSTFMILWGKNYWRLSNRTLLKLSPNLNSPLSLILMESIWSMWKTIQPSRLMVAFWILKDAILILFNSGFSMEFFNLAQGPQPESPAPSTTTISTSTPCREPAPWKKMITTTTSSGMHRVKQC